MIEQLLQLAYDAALAFEGFLAEWEHIAWFFFSMFGFTWAVIRIGNSLYNWIGNREKLKQRHEFQAGYFDTQEARYDKLLDKMTDLSDDAALIRLLMQRNNIKRTTEPHSQND